MGVGWDYEKNGYPKNLAMFWNMNSSNWFFSNKLRVIL
jgi:hypothetical protein